MSYIRIMGVFLIRAELRNCLKTLTKKGGDPDGSPPFSFRCYKTKSYASSAKYLIVLTIWLV